MRAIYLGLAPPRTSCFISGRSSKDLWRVDCGSAAAVFSRGEGALINDASEDKSRELGVSLLRDVRVVGAV